MLKKESQKARNGCFATQQHVVQCFIEESGILSLIPTNLVVRVSACVRLCVCTESLRLEKMCVCVYMFMCAISLTLRLPLPYLIPKFGMES